MPSTEALSTRIAGTLVEKPCSRSKTTSEVLRSLSETIMASREQLGQVAGGGFSKQLELTTDLESGSTSSRCLR